MKLPHILLHVLCGVFSTVINQTSKTSKFKQTITI